MVTISGVDEIAFGKEDDFQLKRLKVGNRPVDVAIDSTGKKAFIANSFDDSVSVFDLTTEKIEGTIALGKLRQLTEIEKGEQLFFDASLSHDGWMSCHSCHSDGHTNGGLNDNFSDGSFWIAQESTDFTGTDGYRAVRLERTHQDHGGSDQGVIGVDDEVKSCPQRRMDTGNIGLCGTVAVTTCFGGGKR